MRVMLVSVASYARVSLLAWDLCCCGWLPALVMFRVLALCACVVGCDLVRGGDGVLLIELCHYEDERVPYHPHVPAVAHAEQNPLVRTPIQYTNCLTILCAWSSP